MTISGITLSISEFSAGFGGAPAGPAVPSRVHDIEGGGDPLAAGARRHPAGAAEEPARQQQGVAGGLERRVSDRNETILHLFCSLGLAWLHTVHIEIK